MNFALALQTLAKHEVEFVLVGGGAVVAHGSSLMTQDLDILYRVEPENVRRLLAAFEELDAYVYGDPKRLRFDRPRDRAAVVEFEAIRRLQSQ